MFWGPFGRLFEETCILIFLNGAEDGGSKCPRNVSHTLDSRTMQIITQKEGQPY